MRLTPLLSLLALLAPPTTPLLSAGCGCTDVGYENGLQVAIEVPPVPDQYRIEAESDGDILSIRYEVTAHGTLCTGACRSTGEHVILEDSMFSSSLDLLVNIRRVDDTGGPRRATVRVFRRAEVVAEATFEPRYQTDEPNGRGCGEQVRASETLVVP